MEQLGEDAQGAEEPNGSASQGASRVSQDRDRNPGPHNGGEPAVVALPAVAKLSQLIDAGWRRSRGADSPPRGAAPREAPQTGGPKPAGAGAGPGGATGSVASAAALLDAAAAKGGPPAQVRLRESLLRPG